MYESFFGRIFLCDRNFGSFFCTTGLLDEGFLDGIKLDGEFLYELPFRGRFFYRVKLDGEFLYDWNFGQIFFVRIELWILSLKNYRPKGWPYKKIRPKYLSYKVTSSKRAGIPHFRKKFSIRPNFNDKIKKFSVFSVFQWKLFTVPVCFHHLKHCHVQQNFYQQPIFIIFSKRYFW